MNEGVGHTQTARVSIEENMTTLTASLLTFLRRGGMPDEEAQESLLALLRLQGQRVRGIIRIEAAQARREDQ